MKRSINYLRCKFFKVCMTILIALPFISCNTLSPEMRPVEPRLTARPGIPDGIAAKGLTRLNLSEGQGGTLYVPESYSPDIPMPLFIAMHGSGEDSSIWKSYQARSEERGFIILAPDSQRSTWDLIKGGYGADLIFLDKALEYVFERCSIDHAHIALCGFSDGASYALSLGISNGDLFTHLIGYSPGFISGKKPIVGKPRIYISHGKKDTVFPVRVTRESIVSAFRKVGYDVVYNEFEGGHEVSAAVSEAALNWFLSAE